MMLIKNYQEKNGRDPLVSELARLLLVPEVNIYSKLQKLRKRGFIGLDVCVKSKNQHLRQKFIRDNNLGGDFKNNYIKNL